MDTNVNYDEIAIGDIGTQLFAYENPPAPTYTSSVAPTSSTAGQVGDIFDVVSGDTHTYKELTSISGTSYTWETYTPKFRYAFPVTAGAEFGGDSESYEANETDLDYTAKVIGRKNLNDVAYTLNYTAEKYNRAKSIISRIEQKPYMEVFSDGSAMIFKATANSPTITGGDIRQMNVNFVPSYEQWISNIYDLTDADIANLESDWYTTSGTKKVIKIDKLTIPSIRRDYQASR